MTFLSVIIICISFIALIIFVNTFLRHMHLLVGFQKETKETLNFGIPDLNVNDTVKIQYTAKREQCVDERFIKPGRYIISNYILPIIASIFVGLIGSISLAISVITDTGVF